VLDLTRLQAINGVLLNDAAGSGILRTIDGRKRSEYHDPAPAVILPRLVENALDWFETQSFSEIHPVEQAAVVLLRLTDLQPFDQLNEETAFLAGSLFLQRASLPPLIVEADAATMSEYSTALEAAFRMLTQPLVEFLSKTLIRTIAQANV
jgi:Fic family protein